MQSVQSRLKSRRLLGVGEGADGLQPRSKISFLFPEQILPEDLRDIGNSPSQQSHLITRINTYAVAALRLYGAAMLAVTCLLCVVTFLHWSSRRAVRTALLVKVVYFSCELAVAGIAKTSGVGIEWRIGNTLIFSALKFLIIGLSVYYYRRIRTNNQPIGKRLNSD